MMFQSGRRLKQLMRGARQSGWANARRQKRLKVKDRCERKDFWRRLNDSFRRGNKI